MLYMSCDSPRTVHTIGHSTRTIDAFIEFLKAHAIDLLVDVRRWAASRRYPHFNRGPLGASLQANGIDYLWRGGLRRIRPSGRSRERLPTGCVALCAPGLSCRCP